MQISENVVPNAPFHWDWDEAKAIALGAALPRLTGHAEHASILARDRSRA
jgi:hypothetical protein